MTFQFTGSWMNTKKFVVADLISTSGRKSNTKKLSEILDQVEQAIADGVPYVELVQALEVQEIMTISVPSFRLALHRIRWKQRTPEKGGVALVQSSHDSTRTSNPSINSTEPALSPASTNVQMTLQEIQDQAPHLSAKDRRARFADQYMQDAMHPLTKRLLEKNK